MKVRECASPYNGVYVSPCEVNCMQTRVVMMENVAMGDCVIISDVPSMVKYVVGMQKVGVFWF